MGATPVAVTSLFDTKIARTKVFNHYLTFFMTFLAVINYLICKVTRIKLSTSQRPSQSTSTEGAFISYALYYIKKRAFADCYQSLWII